MYDIPLFDLNYDEDEKQAVYHVFRDKWISSGPRCLELEERMQEMFNCKYALATSSCTAALHLAMLVLGLGPGDEVIVPSLTFVATVNAVRYVGATPVFCDVDSFDRPVIDPEMIEKSITDQTKVIVVMHYGGFACDMDRIMKIARKHNLMVVEDACHGPLSTYKGKKLGAIGDVGCFSFFSNKNVSTGEGGALITNNEDYYKRAKLLRSHGMTSMSYERSTGHAVQYDVVELGYNYRLDDIRASLGIVQFDKLPEDMKRRASVRERYIHNLSGIDELIIPFMNYTETSSSYIFPIILMEKYHHGDKIDNAVQTQVREKLKGAGIQTSVHYPAIHRFKIYQNFVDCNLPNTDYIATHEVSLPMYGKLKSEEIDYICNILKQTILDLVEKSS